MRFDFLHQVSAYDEILAETVTGDLERFGLFNNLAGIHDAVESGFWEFEIAPEFGPPIFRYPVVYEIRVEKAVDENAAAKSF